MLCFLLQWRMIFDIINMLNMPNDMLQITIMYLGQKETEADYESYKKRWNNS